MRERWHLTARDPISRHRSPEQTEEKLTELAEKNRMTREFAFGKLLGTAFGDCVATEPQLVHMEETYENVPDEFRTVVTDQLPGKELIYKLWDRSWKLFIDGLKNDPVFLDLELSTRGLLDRLWGPKSGIGHGYFGLDVDYSDASALSDAFCMRTGLCRILGYVLGDLRHADAEAINRDQRGAAPRQFPTTDPTRNLATASFVRHHGGNLQTLCEQLWPHVPSHEMLNHLKRAAGGSLHERDFAKVALPLFAMYQDAREHGTKARLRVHDEVHFREAMPELGVLSRLILAERSRGRVDIAKSIAAGESRHAEFKSSARWDLKLKKRSDDVELAIVKTVAAFLNCEGGNLLIGVDDNGSVVGLDDDFKTLGKRQNCDGFEQWLWNKMSDHFGNSAHEFIRVNFHEKDGKFVCQVTADAAPRPCYVGAGKQLFVRRGNSTVSLDPEQAIAYYNSHWKK